MVDRLALADLTSVFIAGAECIPRQTWQTGRGSGFPSPSKGDKGGVQIKGSAQQGFLLQPKPPFEGEGGCQIRPCPERIQAGSVPASDGMVAGARGDLRME